MAAVLTRRSVLSALGVGLGVVLVGCDSDPDPTVTTATPGPKPPGEPADPTAAGPADTPDTAALLLALDRARHLATRCRAITGAEGWRLQTQEQVQVALDEQARVLEEVLRAGAVAVPEPTSPPAGSGDTAGSTDAGTATGSPDTSTGTGDVSPTGGDAAQDTAAVAAERAATELLGLGEDCLQDVSPTALTALTEVSAANLPMLLSVAGQRGAAAQLLGQEPQWEVLEGPTGAPAAELLDAFRPAVYGFEVLAARARGEERAVYERVLTPLRQATRQITQLAGESASPAPLGYGLPGGTGSPDGRARLAGELLAVLPPTIMLQTTDLAGDRASVAGSVRLLADAVRLARPWNALTAFPGMQVPGA
ncbi:DUF4439 domain-containing protein [Ornithinimicrobium cavernae]|uniref:DUF4439 domain-containing protein n=1 Tax=Ornithinimicrobium cavernae TaxID=2666047 RepID=UPI000D68D943|nr:DUF4439 domain-containing protein [Ornithinimicrobium cavernae]